MNKLLTHIVFSLLLCAALTGVARAQGGKREDPPKPPPKRKIPPHKPIKPAEPKTTETVQPEPVPLASITITVVPSGSKLSLNEQQVEGPTVMGLTPGTYVLKVSHEGYQEDLRSITLVPGENSPINIVLQPIQGTLNVSPNITGALIGIRKSGSSDASEEHYAGELANLKLTPGDYQVTVSKEGYKTVTRAVSLQASGTVYLEPQLEILPAKDSTTSKPAEPATRTSAVQSDRYEEAVIVKRVAPIYPPAARNMNTSGVVIVSVQIDGNGNVKSAKAVEGPNVLRQSAESAAKQWKFRPARQNGQIVEATQQIKFMFQP